MVKKQLKAHATDRGTSLDAYTELDRADRGGDGVVSETLQGDNTCQF